MVRWYLANPSRFNFPAPVQTCPSYPPGGVVDGSCTLRTSTLHYEAQALLLTREKQKPCGSVGLFCEIYT